jgi:hypothetical protein
VFSTLISVRFAHAKSTFQTDSQASLILIGWKFFKSIWIVLRFFRADLALCNALLKSSRITGQVLQFGYRLGRHGKQ